MEPEHAFSIVTSAYYRGVPVAAVGTALQYFLQMLAGAGWPMDDRLANVTYMFCRIAQSSPDARREIVAQQVPLSGRAAELVEKILVAAEDATFPNPLTRNIVGPASLDLLWAEFFVTGDSEPVLRIVRTLDASDGIRRLLSAWLHERSWFSGGKRAEQVETLRKVGLAMDLKTRSIGTEGDLDCLCFALAEQKVPIFQLLPCSLPQSDLLNLTIKGAALWSLRLNSRDHDVVRSVCEVECARPGGHGRTLLLEPIVGQKPFAL